MLLHCIVFHTFNYVNLSVTDSITVAACVFFVSQIIEVARSNLKLLMEVCNK